MNCDDKGGGDSLVRPVFIHATTRVAFFASDGIKNKAIVTVMILSFLFLRNIVHLFDKLDFLVCSCILFVNVLIS